MESSSPLISPYFRVSIAGDGKHSGAAFSVEKVSQVSAEMGVLEGARGMGSLSRIRIEGAISGGKTTELDAWWKEITDPGKTLSKRIVDIYQTDETGNDLQGWRLKNAWITKTGVTTVDQGSTSAFVRLFYELVAEEIERPEPGARSAAKEPPAPSENKNSVPTPKAGESVAYGKNISVKGTPVFQKTVLADLAVLASIPTGALLLKSINEGNHPVTISQCGKRQDSAGARIPPNPNDLTNGVGTPANVRVSGERVDLYGNGLDWDNAPSAVILGHELIHAHNYANGKREGLDYDGGPQVPTYPGSTDGKYSALEERRTVGLPADKKLGFPGYENEPFTENKIRAELGEPLRTSYLDPTSGGLW